MQTLPRQLTAASAAILMLVFSGVAAATVISNHGPQTNPALRVYPFCPSRDQPVPSSSTTGADATLVPAGARQVLLCRYRGFGVDPKPVGSGSFRLIAHHLVSTRATVKGLASELNALKPATGVRACPSDNGTAIIAFFRYGSAPKADDPVTVDLSGCSSVTNGHLQRTAGTLSGLKLLRQLEALTALVAPAGKGVLTGKIVLVGGDPLASRFSFGGVVAVFGPGHKAVAHLRVRAGHRFRIELFPGRYQLTVDPSYGCPRRMVRVQAGRTTRFNVDTGCNVY
ncbi:MAG: hypothetical protein ACR2L9_04640 [Solirubrobacteraceae bacterium]